jgi:hypothetical protein
VGEEANKPNEAECFLQALHRPSSEERLPIRIVAVSVGTTAATYLHPGIAAAAFVAAALIGAVSSAAEVMAVMAKLQRIVE